MSNLFSNKSTFNSMITGWNVAQVTSFVGAFEGAMNFNQNLNTWCVSRVTLIASLFNGASAFNQDLNGWNFSAVDASWCRASSRHLYFAVSHAPPHPGVVDIWNAYMCVFFVQLSRAVSTEFPPSATALHATVEMWSWMDRVRAV